VPVWHDYREQRNGRFHTVVGDVKLRERLWSPELRNQRDIAVYLPPSYRRDSERRYPVIYMHDGQNLFDQATSYAGEWQVDETMEKLAADGYEAIIVGIDNMGGKRIAEYGPFVDPFHGPGEGERYVAFLTETLKPQIDREFRTLLGPEFTGVFGSSMGGLISLFAFFYAPEVYGLVGAMSPSIWYADDAILGYVEEAPWNPGRIYLDAGTREYGGFTEKGAKRQSRRYYARVRRLKRVLVRKGYRPIVDLLHVEEKWAGHNEPAWARRLPLALRFLLRDARDAVVTQPVP